MEQNYPRVLNLRFLEIILSVILILLLSPLFILITILLQIESFGPIFCYSYRVSENFHIFKFYKFRVIKLNNEIKNKKENHNANRLGFDKSYNGNILNLNGILVSDLGIINENEFLIHESENLKISYEEMNLTRVGKLITYLNLDKLPQIFNVLNGDLKFFGDSPLTLKEAEGLTTDEYVKSLLRPIGLLNTRKKYRIIHNSKDVSSVRLNTTEVSFSLNSQT